MHSNVVIICRSLVDMNKRLDQLFLHSFYVRYLDMIFLTIRSFFHYVPLFLLIIQFLTDSVKISYADRIHRRVAKLSNDRLS